MYLALLNSDQKQIFLELALVLASADGRYSNEEKAVIESYCREMQVDMPKDIMKKTPGEIIKDIDELCMEQEKKIIIFETIGLAISDGIYHDSEKELIWEMIKKFDLQEEFGKECETVVEEYIEFQKKINHLVIE